MRREEVLVLNRLVIAVFGVWMLALTAAFYAFPGWHLVLWSSLALSSVGAIVVGVLVHRPARPLPWWLLAVALTLFAAGDTTYIVLTTMLGQDNPFPSLADVFYLAMYPIAAAGLVMLIRHRTGGRDRGSLLDALSLTTALALLSWIFLISPYVRDGGPLLGRTGDVDRLPARRRADAGDAARLMITAGRNPAARCSLSAPPGLLASDVLYGLEQLEGSCRSATPTTWAGSSSTRLGRGSAAPVDGRDHRPGSGPSAEMSFRRLALLVAVSFVAPGTLMVDSLGGDVPNGPMISVSSAVLFLLVLVRLSGVVSRHRAGRRA